MFECVSLIVNVLTMLGTIAAVVVALCLYWAAQRPDVIAYLSHDRDNGCVFFIVENVGKGVARDIEIGYFDFGFVQEKYRDYVEQRSFLAKGIPVLVPGASRSTIILDGPEIKDYSMVVSEVSLSYRRRCFRRHKIEKVSFPLDYYSFSGSVYAKSDLHKMMVAAEVIAGIRSKEQAKND